MDTNRCADQSEDTPVVFVVSLSSLGNVDIVSCSKTQHLMLAEIEPVTSRFQVRCFTTTPKRCSLPIRCVMYKGSDAQAGLGTCRFSLYQLKRHWINTCTAMVGFCLRNFTNVFCLHNFTNFVIIFDRINTISYSVNGPWSLMVFLVDKFTTRTSGFILLTRTIKKKTIVMGKI